MVKQKIKINKLVWLFIFIYVLVLSFFSFWKYFNFLYNGLDLAIFNQVFFNTAQGRFFDFSLHPGSYLADHFTPIILFFSPFYNIFSSPLFLLFLQSLFLGLVALPVYLISKEIFFEKKIPLILAGAVLLNPFLWNINLFEFHILSFVLFPLLLTFYFYQKKNFKLFVFFIFFSLIVREDVSFIVFMLSFLPFFSLFQKGSRRNIFLSFQQIFKKNKKWIFTPLLLSIIWFICSFQIISQFNLDGSYKFLTYYQWLGNSNSAFGLLFNILAHPLKVFFHLVTFNNFVIVLILLFCFLFLPLLAKRYFILALPYFLQLFLTDDSGNSLIFTTHYAIFFVFVLIISSIYGLKNFISWRKEKIIKWQKKKQKYFFWRIFLEDKLFLYIFSVVAVVYLVLFIGPGWGLMSNFFSKEIKTQRIIVNKLIKKIPAQSSVVASYRFLPNLSNRRKIYSLHYAFLGKRQFLLGDYKLPADIDYFLLDSDDFVIYQLQFQNRAGFHSQYITGDKRIKNYLKNFQVIDFMDKYILLGRGQDDLQKIFFVYNRKKTNNQLEKRFFKDKINLNYHNCSKKEFNKDNLILNCFFSWSIDKKINKNYQLVLDIFQNNQEIDKKIYPLSAGFFPSSKWKENNEIINYYKFVLPKKYLQNNFSLQFGLIDIDLGHAELNNFGSIVGKIEKANYSDLIKL